MRRAQQARQRLRGHWPKTTAVEIIILSARMLLSIISLTALRLTGLGAENIIHVSKLWSGGWLFGLITIVLIIIDWLLLSPILLGRLSYYLNIATGENAPIHLVLSFYGRRYSQALRWRLAKFWRRTLYLTICLMPSALTSGIAKAVRLRGAGTPVGDVILLLCTLFGFILFLTGIIISVMLMLRLLPAPMILIKDENKKYPKRLFKGSAIRMRRHIIEMFQLVTGFSGWIVSCLLIFPYFYVMPLFITTRTIAVRKIMACTGDYVDNKKSKLGKRHRNKAPEDTVILPPINDKKQPC